MKKAIPLLLSSISLLIFCSGSCKKNSDLSCANVTSTGRIIGYDPCLNYLTFNKVDGAGFVIEIDNGTTKDTATTYNIPAGMFTFLPEYIHNSAYYYLFRPEVQDLFKIKFNYRYANTSEKTIVICSGPVYPAYFYAATREKQIIISCISAQ